MNGVRRMNVNRWNLFAPGSVNRRIFRGILNVGSLQLIVSAAAILKELFLADQFGTTDEMDAFLVAFLLPSLVMNMVNGSFDVAFIPEFIRLREQKGEKEAGVLFSNVLGFYLVFLLFLSLILFFVSPLVLSLLTSDFESQARSLTQSLFFILLPLLIVSGLVNAWGSVLKAGEHFSLLTLSPAIVHVVAVLCLYFTGGLWGIKALAVGMMLGLLFQCGILFWGMKSRDAFCWPRWPGQGIDDSIKRVSGQYFPMIVGSLLMGGTLFVDQSMAASIGAGSVSSLNYGNKIVLFVLGLSAMALSTAVFPHFSKMVALEDWKGVRHILKTYARLILIISIPLTLLLIYFSEPIIRIVFERGAFTARDTVRVGEIQALYLLQVPFYLTGILGVRLLSALSKNQILMVIGGASLFVNTLGNYIAMQYWGVAGISLSTSIVYFISMFMIYGALDRQLKQRERQSEALH